MGGGGAAGPPSSDTGRGEGGSCLAAAARCSLPATPLPPHRQLREYLRRGPRRHGGGGGGAEAPSAATLEQQQRLQEAELPELASLIAARLRAIAPHVAAVQVRREEGVRLTVGGKRAVERNPYNISLPSLCCCRATLRACPWATRRRCSATTAPSEPSSTGRCWGPSPPCRACTRPRPSSRCVGQWGRGGGGGLLVMPCCVISPPRCSSARGTRRCSVAGQAPPVSASQDTRRGAARTKRRLSSSTARGRQG